MSATPSPTDAVRRLNVTDIARMYGDGERIAMLTAYDYPTAKLLDEAGIPLLLVGDSLGRAMLGYENELSVTMDDMLHHAAAVTRGARRALVVGDMPFLSYATTDDALKNAGRFIHDASVQAVKVEGGVRSARIIETLVKAGIPVMGHIGFTPQSEHQLGGYRVQGRGDDAQRLLDDAHAVEDAGAFGVVLEMVPGDLARKVTGELEIPTVGIGAGPDCDAQVLVWQDMLGLRRGKMQRFVKQYADLAKIIGDAAGAYVDEVRNGTFPSEQHTFASTIPIPEGKS